MGQVTLSSAVRNNLLSLQRTAVQLGKTQERLASGLKVNSALDDPTAFFTAAGLNSRAGDLNRLLDSVGNAVQTIKAADQGISAITKLVESAQATARQALQKPGPATSATAATLTGTGAAVAADTAATTFGSAIAADVAAVANSSTGGGIDGTELLNSGEIGLADGDTLTITGGGFANVSISFQTAGTASTGNNLSIGTATVNNLITEINAQAGATIASIVGGELRITGQNTTADITFGGTNAATTLGYSTTAEPTNAAFAAAIAAGATLTFTINGSTDSIVFGTNDAGNQVSNRQELAARLTAISGGGGNTGATFALNGSNQVQVTAAAAANGDIVIDGGATALALAGFTSGQRVEPGNTTLGAITQGQTLTIQIGGASQTVTFGSNDANSEVNNKAELDARLAAIQSAFGAGTAVSADASGNLTVTAGNSTDSITLGGTASLTTFGSNLSTVAVAPIPGATVNNADRAALETQFNALRNQIDQLAADASFNGNNLLNGDNLTVIFNENNTSSLSITGVTFNASGLGVSAAAANSFQSNTSINTTLTELDTAISTLRQQASTFGNNLSIVEVRQDFTKDLINTLETGAANLTLADSNEEGANLLALQTRQQLSSVALSLASQADQNVLRLF